MGRKAKAEKTKRAKKVTVAYIDRKSRFSGYERMDKLIDQHHPHLKDAKIALAWMYGKKEDTDGRLVLGRAKKGSDLDRELNEFDFVIMLNHEAWNMGSFTEEQQLALLDHELCHCQVSIDTSGELKKDEKGRIVYRSRKHDVEEFSEIVARHGMWKRDLEQFAQSEMKFNDSKRPLLNGLENGEDGKGHQNGNGHKPVNRVKKAMAK